MKSPPLTAPATPSQLLEQLVVVPDQMEFVERRAAAAERWTALLSNCSADDECVHGRLPHDPTPDCGCWT